jgi:hypothetical protein
LTGDRSLALIVGVYRTPRHRRLRLLLLLAALASPCLLLAVDATRIRIASIVGEGWRLDGLQAELELAANAPAARLHIAHFALPAGLGVARDVQVTCPAATVSGHRYQCDAATVAGDLGTLGAQRFTASVDYDATAGTLELAAQGVRLAGTDARVELRSTAEGWRARIAAAHADAPALRRLLAPFATLPEDWTLEGHVDLDVHLTGSGSTLSAIEGEAHLAAITLASADGTLATEQLAGTARFTLTPRTGATGVALKFAGTGGQAYFEPVFLDVAQQPFVLEATGNLRDSDGVFDVTAFRFDQPGAVAAAGSAELDFAGAIFLRRAKVDLEKLTFPGAFSTYVAPFLATTDFRKVTARGEISGKVAVSDGLPTLLDVEIRDVTLDDPNAALALEALRGHLRWYDNDTRRAIAASDEDTDAFRSELSWKGGRVYGLDLGATHLVFTTGERDFRLLEPAFLPVLDGGIDIETFRVRHAGTPEMWLRLDAVVRPISVQLLCRAFGWPEFGGKLSGSIPKAALDHGVLTFGGNLEAKIFDGSVVISDLRMQNPLGRFPRLFANAEFRNLNLEQVTGTFSFGVITGLLSGEIKGLELFDWTPVAFDARFYTPRDDRTRHRISQRAIENISSLGGGGSAVTAALSSGFLKFFQDFNYSRLGISCRLVNDVCYMDGIGRKGEGYYIVKGRFVPRIDIIGNGRRVAWTQFVEQLLAITESGPAEVH